MKTLKLFQLFIAITVLLIPSALSAKQTAEDRFTEPFTGVSAGSVFKVFITQSDDFSVTLNVSDEHLEFVETRVKDDVLYLEFTGRDRRLRGLEVHISAPVYKFLQASGASNIVSSDNINADALELIVSGASNMDLTLNVESLKTTISGASGITLNGEAVSHDLVSSGVSSVRAYGLETHTANVKSSGTSSVRIRVTDTIVADASGTSSITVRGNPPNSSHSASAAASIRGLGTIQTADTEIAEEDDTTVVRIGEREVIIYDGKRPEIRTRKTAKTTWRKTWSGFYLGVNGYLTPSNSINLGSELENLDLEYNNSISVNLNLLQQDLFTFVGKNSAFGMFTGLGIGWNNYRFERNTRLNHEEDKLTFPLDEKIDFRKNKLTVSHLNAPLMLEFQTNQRNPNGQFHISAGVNVSMRLRSHTKYVYRDDGNREKDKEFRSYHLVPFRYEAIARIGWGRVNLFATYALNGMFKENRGPELYPFNIGLRLINF